MLLQLELRLLPLQVFFTPVVALHMGHFSSAGAGEKDLAARARRADHHHVIRLTLVLRADHFVYVKRHWTLREVLRRKPPLVFVCLVLYVVL